MVSAVAPSIALLSRAIILLVHFPSPSRLVGRANPIFFLSFFLFFFFSTVASSRFRDDLLRSRRRPSSFFHPLNHPASTLSSRALNASAAACRTASPPPLPPSRPSPFRLSTSSVVLLARAQSRLRNLLSSLEPALSGRTAFHPLPNPNTPARPHTSFLVGRARSPAISHRHPCVTLRRQTPISGEVGEEGRRTKLHRDRSRTPLVYIYSRSHRGLLSGGSRDGNSIRTVYISF